MNKTQARKLERLAKLLDRLPEENFDMHHFAPHTPDWEWLDRDDIRDPSQEIKCGTACCVAGWAAIQNRKTWPSSENGDLDVDTMAFTEFYGLKYSEAHSLCLRDFGAKPSTKAKQIRRLIAKRKEGVA